jgi:hypothetical protein
VEEIDNYLQRTSALKKGRSGGREGKKGGGEGEQAGSTEQSKIQNRCVCVMF